MVPQHPGKNDGTISSPHRIPPALLLQDICSGKSGGKRKMESRRRSLVPRSVPWQTRRKTPSVSASDLNDAKP